MCIIILKTKGAKPIPTAQLVAAEAANRDGFGFAASTGDGKLIIDRGDKTHAAFLADIDQYNRPGATLLVHYRIATGSKTTQRNRHPFPINDGRAALAHNGILAGIESTRRDSDTRRFCRAIVTPFLAGGGNPNDRVFRAMLEEYLGARNSVVILQADGSHTIYNEGKQTGYAGDAHWHDGIWYSNESYKDAYRFKPTSPAHSGQIVQRTPAGGRYYKTASGGWKNWGWGDLTDSNDARRLWEQEESNRLMLIDEAYQAAEDADFDAWENNFSDAANEMDEAHAPDELSDDAMPPGADRAAVLWLPQRTQKCVFCDRPLVLDARLWSKPYLCAYTDCRGGGKTQTLAHGRPMDTTWLKALAHDSPGSLSIARGDVILDRPNKGERAILTDPELIKKTALSGYARFIAATAIVGWQLCRFDEVAELAHRCAVLATGAQAKDLAILHEDEPNAQRLVMHADALDSRARSELTGEAFRLADPVNPKDGKAARCLQNALINCMIPASKR